MQRIITLLNQQAGQSFEPRSAPSVRIQIAAPDQLEATGELTEIEGDPGDETVKELVNLFANVNPISELLGGLHPEDLRSIVRSWSGLSGCPNLPTPYIQDLEQLLSRTPEEERELIETGLRERKPVKPFDDLKAENSSTPQTSQFFARYERPGSKPFIPPRQ